jgi:hypothetical protein
MSAISTVVADVTAAIAEIDAQLVAVAPKLEGLRDYERLNIQEGTRREVNDAIGDYVRRVDLLNAAKASYQTLLDTAVAQSKALVEDGAPDLPVRQISAGAIADLQDQLDTITAARALFEAQASGLNPSAGGTEPK